MFNQNDSANTVASLLKLKAVQEETLGIDHPDYAATLNSLGMFYFSMGDYARAEKYLLEAKDIWESVLDKDHPDYAAPLNNLGLLYDSMGDYAKAEKYLLEAKDIWEKMLDKDHPNYATTLNSLGALYFSMRDYAQTEKYFLDTKDILEKTLSREHPHYASTLSNLGELYHSTRNYAQAEKYFLEAKDIREKILGKEHPDYTSTLNSLGGLYNDMGDLYHSTGDYAQAEKYYLEAKDIRERIPGKDHPDYASTLNSLGYLHKEMGDYAQAEKYLLESKNIWERTLGKDHPDYAGSLNNLGELYHSTGDYAQAEKYHLEVKNIWERTLGKDHPDYAGTLNNLGYLYNDMKDYAHAEKYLLEAKDTLERTLGKEHRYYAVSLNNLGYLYYFTGDYAQAEKYYLEAKNIWERTLGKDHPDYVRSIHNLSGLYLSMGNCLQALVYQNESTQLDTRIVNQAFSFLSGQQREKYWNVYSFSFETSYSLSWFHPVPESSALSYNNALFCNGLLLRSANAVRDSIHSTDDQGLIAQYEDLCRLRRQIEALRQSGGRSEAYILKLEEQADAADKTLTRFSAAFREFQADLALGWQDVRNSLRLGEAAVEFVTFRLIDKERIGRIIYAALLLRPGIEAPAWIPLCAEPVLEKFLQKLDDKDAGQRQAQILYGENGPALYAVIWQPMEKFLEGVQTVYYSPSGLLHKICFNAIPVTESTRLMDVYDLNLVSSTREVAYRSAKTARMPKSAVIYGGLQYDMDTESMVQEALAYTVTQRNIPLPKDFLRDDSQFNWEPLRFTKDEGFGIQKILTENKIPVTLYIGTKGNKESFKSLDGKKTNVIHLATHGFFLNDIERNYEEREWLERLGGGKKAVENPLMRSGLLLAGCKKAWEGSPVEDVENGILFGADVAQMNLLGAELIVLSACETALGVVNNSEGVFGLQRAFKLAGVETIVMSLWEVADRATSELMKCFYQNWLSGMSKQDAFKTAQRSMRESKEYSSPYFWAAFVMMD
ncbi:MAG: CHAT domain-containing protein [Treponema sp.]|jgi:tetratricopeptide (TPR) repeat protein|nr:CHAT domain-containing protein [Treponema sp.]